jgi:uncharacterized protein (DUF1330 family)
MVNPIQAAKAIEKLLRKIQVHVSDSALLDDLGDVKSTFSKKQVAEDKAVIDKALKKHGGSWFDSTDRGHIFEFDTKEQAQRFYKDTAKTPNSTLMSNSID